MNIIITGGSSGLGFAISRQFDLAESDEELNIINWDIDSGVDVSSPEEICRAAEEITNVDCLINCAGENWPQPIKNITIAEWQHHMRVNAFSHLLLTKTLWHKLKALNGGVVCNIISNASHVPMSNSCMYNASKAAAAMVTRQMAHELRGQGVTIFGVSPNRLKGTAMSQYVDCKLEEITGLPKQEILAKQLSKLPAGEETEPFAVAEFIVFLLSQKHRHKYLHGAILEYGA